MKSDFSPSRRTWNVIMTALVWAAAVLVIALTVGVIGLVLVRGIPNISWEFLSTTASVLKGTDGILPAILNTLYVILLTLLIVLPLGVGAAVYLTEYASNRKLIEVIEFTNETLAGIPSIIYGLVGMLVFAQTMGFKTCLLSIGTLLGVYFVKPLKKLAPVIWLVAIASYAYLIWRMFFADEQQ